MSFKLNLDGGAEVLKELAAPLIAKVAQEIAENAGEGAEVQLSTSDRARAVVRVPADAQARDGVLTRAAAAAGLEVRPSRGGRKPRK